MGTAPVTTRLHDLENVAACAASGPAPDLSRRPNESLDDWADRLEAQAIARLPLLHSQAELINEGLDWFHTYQGLMLAKTMIATTATNLTTSYLARIALRFTTDPQLMARVPAIVARALEFVNKQYLDGKAAFMAPGSSFGLVGNRLIKIANAGDPLPDIAEYLKTQSFGPRILANRHVGDALRRGDKLPWDSITKVSGNVFGRTWKAVDGIEFGRGSSNLIRVARETPAGKVVSTVGKTAGFLRGAGIVGGSISTGMDIANIASKSDPGKAFKRDKAGYVADLAKTGFDGSLTAAMIAPTPVTWGAVAVTGTVWAGSELVDHWDDVSAATDKAADWAGDLLDDTGNVASTAVDAVKKSHVNPANWF